jgi:hypothetical protein
MPDHASLALSKELAGVAIQSGTGAQPPKDTIMTTQQILTQIAQKHLRLETLETRKSDSLDFHDLAVWSIEAALKAAFEAGKEAAGK